MFKIFQKNVENKEKSKVKSSPNEIDKEVSKNLKSRRILLGLIQKDIAKEVGVTIQQVQKYEKGINRIAAGTLFGLAQFLKVPIDYFYQQSDKGLIGGDNFSSEGGGVPCEHSSSSNAQTITLVREFRKIKNPRDRRKVIDMIKMVN
jgi:transcriptional regulator with XRE-family HTH domain